MNNNEAQTAGDAAAAFQKIWMESMSKTMQTAFTLTPGSAPPEVLRHFRGGILQALTESWEEFMRSPQFLEGMKQSMENSVAFRKLTSGFMAHARNAMQSPSRDDIDTLMLTVRHLEKRLLDKVEDLSVVTDDLNQRLDSLERRPAADKVPTGKSRKSAGRRGPGTKKAGVA